LQPHQPHQHAFCKCYTVFGPEDCVISNWVWLLLQALLAEFEAYIKQHKTVALDELAAEFGLRTQDAITRVQELEASGRLTGVMDDRGKVRN
jgi:DDRGK domain